MDTIHINARIFTALSCAFWGTSTLTCFRLLLRCAAIITLRCVFEPQRLPLSKALYHTCFICGQRCKCWSRRLKLTSSVISDVKPIIYIYIYIYILRATDNNKKWVMTKATVFLIWQNFLSPKSGRMVWGGQKIDTNNFLFTVGICMDLSWVGGEKI